MAKRKQQDEMAPNGPGIAGIFNEAPTYYLPGTPGDVGALAIDYSTMRAEPWNQTAAPIPIPSSPQGEILAAPPGADAPQFATGQTWKDYYNLMANEVDLYRKYLKNYHDLGGEYFPKIIATNKLYPGADSEVAGWYEPKSKNVYIPLYSTGYEAGGYTDVGPTMYQVAPGVYENVTPIARDPKNRKMSIRMDMSPIPHEIGHYYDFTGGQDYGYSYDDLQRSGQNSLGRQTAADATNVRPPQPLTRQYKQMSWSGYDREKMNPWDYILTNTAGTIRPDQATGDEQSWFLSGGQPLREQGAFYNVPAEVFADYFRKAMQASLLNDFDRVSELYGGAKNSPLALQFDPDSQITMPKKGSKAENEYQRWEATAREAASNEADRINTKAKKSPNATSVDTWPEIFDAVANVAESLPPAKVQSQMQPMLTDQAREFLYWLFTRGYTPR